jgi:hypothetical protein
MLCFLTKEVAFAAAQPGNTKKEQSEPNELSLSLCSSRKLDEHVFPAPHPLHIVLFCCGVHWKDHAREEFLE